MPRGPPVGPTRGRRFLVGRVAERGEVLPPRRSRQLSRPTDETSLSATPTEILGAERNTCREPVTVVQMDPPVCDTAGVALSL